jgi:phosphoserine phosphatase
MIAENRNFGVPQPAGSDDSMSEIYLINITGRDKPGMLTTLTSTLGSYRVNILDLSQALIHDTVSLAVLIDVPGQTPTKAMLKDVLYEGHNLGLHMQFTRIGRDRYESWVQAQRRKRYIITLLGRTLTSEHIARVTELVQQHRLEVSFITRLSARKAVSQNQDDTSVTCLELSLRGAAKDLRTMRASFLSISQEYGVDIGLQEDTPYRRHRRLIAFDMDSTLIQAEIIDELAARAGMEGEVSRITESAMRGELDFKESLRERVALLRGLDVSVLEEVATGMPLTEGAERLIRNLKVLGYKVAILSGGFTYFGRHLQDRLGIDYVYANELDIEAGKLTGRVRGEIVDGAKKAELLHHLAERENISLEQVIAVGDGANDLPMLDLAGLGIAFRAKPVVREGAEHALSNVGLDAILYFLGLRDREAMA